MTGDISLNASMRSNLLSLQQIAKLQDRTQLRLSTGLKVNSAIDNPSSYYTASSLNNRADDLSALLDAMGQGVQTIKAANEGLEKAEDLISQMKAIAEQVNTGSYVPEKEYFIKEVGNNGAVVSTADELRAAVDSGKETICVYGKIDLGDISATGGLSLQENQKLVGVNYFGNFADGEGFSSISATDSVASHALIDIRKTGCLVSDLSINYVNNVTIGEAVAIKSSGSGVVTDLQNLNIVAKFSDTNTNGYARAAIAAGSGGVTNIQGKMNMKTSGYLGIGIFSSSGSISNILSGANINILTTGQFGYGILTLINSTNNLNGNISITTLGNNSYGIINSVTSGNQTHISSSAQIYLNTTASGFYNGYNDGLDNNILEIAKGAKIAFEKNGTTKWYEVQKDYRDENTSTSVTNYIAADNVEATLDVATASSWQTAADIIEAQLQEAAQSAEEEKQGYQAYQNQFNSALSQYDALIKDSAYKGINLLEEDQLKVNFNEDKSANVLVQGVDVTSKSLGLMSADWQTSKDVAESLSQVLSVRDKLRTAATKLGNYYSIITERQTFTENLINVLTEGADKLTLADMNEESANMLALQTQQNLAVNSLSLASQASQAVLRLF